jgi:hypothetical protein
MKSALRCVARALGDAFRLAFFRDVRAERMAPSWAAIFAAAFATIALPIVVSLWQVGWAGQWGWFSLPFVLLHLPLALAAAIAAAYALGRPADVPRLLYAALLVSLAVDIVTLAVAQSPKLYRALYGLAFLPAAWVALAFAAYACRSVERGLRRLGVVASALILLALPLGALYRDRTLWHPPYNEEAQARGSRVGVADEEAFYEQPRVLERELNAVQPGRKGVIDVFFIGVAGYGSQDVFMREVDAVARLFRERFGAEGRTIRLVNNPKTALDTPIASTTSLREALRRVAAAMDLDEDVLVLFLTSHGSEDQRFSLELWPLRLRSLTPAALRAALDESGIRNRVIVVSACYSGGFVDALRDDNTLVITAAAAHRNSFGCTNEAQWTYFGRAYFDEALRKTHSFAKAFEMAKPVIAEREKKESFDPSEPQMAMGAGIAAKLARLEWQLESDEGAHAQAKSPKAGR